MTALQQEFAQAAARLIQKAQELGFGVTLGEAWRTPEQARWYAEQGIGTACSLHQDRLAIDLNFFRGEVYISDGAQLRLLGEWWKALGPAYRWGGDFKTRPDGNHFSITPDGRRA